MYKVISDMDLKLYEIENKIYTDTNYREYHKDINATLDICYMQYCRLKRGLENNTRREIMRKECLERIETLGRELLVIAELLKEKGVKYDD